MLSTLSRIFELENLDLAEEVVQEAMLKALAVWPYRGIPENPTACLVEAARNKALDVLRRRSTLRRKERELENLLRVRAGRGQCFGRVH
jgi:predicted RNA polymerase sigma factor